MKVDGIILSNGMNLTMDQAHWLLKELEDLFGELDYAEDDEMLTWTPYECKVREGAWSMKHG